MKDMLKSKGMILFIVAFIGITYINALGTARMEKSNNDDTNYVAMNINELI